MLNAKILSSANIHKEARDWSNRVITNGGSVSASTLKAVSNFCYSIDGAGIRNLFNRLNLFCGTNLDAALTPLYLGPSMSTKYGYINKDMNYSFVSEDYVETGSGGGLNAGSYDNGKYLDTGYTIDNTSVITTNNHASAYIMSTVPFQMGANDYAYCCNGCGSYQIEYIQNKFSIYIEDYYGNGYNWYADNYDGNTIGTGFFLGNYHNTYDDIDTGVFKNGIQNTKSSVIPGYQMEGYTNTFFYESTLQFTIFKKNYTYFVDGCILQPMDSPGRGRIGSYSFGKSLTASQNLAYYNALQTFQTVLGRNV